MDPSRSSVTMSRAALRLTAGLSRHSKWMLRNGDSSSLTTIGASPRCDWQIQAEGVAQHAMSVGFFDGALYVASGPDTYVTLNGRPLCEVWRKVTQPAVLRFGAAQLELTPDDMRGADADAESERVTFIDAKICGPGMDAFIGGGRLPSLLETGSEAKRGVSLLRLVGCGLLTAVAYLAWLALLDRV